MKLHKDSRGFTVIELMLTLALLAVFIAVGVPGFAGLVRDNQLVTDANSLVASIQLARSEAIRRSEQVTIRKTSATNNVWEAGWEVFTDVNGNGVRDDDGDNIFCEPNVDTDCVLQQHAAIEGGVTLRTTGGFAQWFAYQPTGFVEGSSSNTDTFSLCKQESGEAIYKNIVITSTGRPFIDPNLPPLINCP